MIKNWDYRERELERLEYQKPPIWESPDSIIVQLQRIKNEFQNGQSEPSNQTFLGLCDLIERMIRDNEEIRHVMESQDLEEAQEDYSQDNFNLDVKAVKDLILEKISMGDVFYPSDVANRYNLDLMTVTEAISELREDGKVSVKQ